MLDLVQKSGNRKINKIGFASIRTWQSEGSWGCMTVDLGNMPASAVAWLVCRTFGSLWEGWVAEKEKR